jgi:hypothetical protein
MTSIGICVKDCSWMDWRIAQLLPLKSEFVGCLRASNKARKGRGPLTYVVDKVQDTLGTADDKRRPINLQEGPSRSGWMC